MTRPLPDSALRELVHLMHQPINVKDMAGEEAVRIMVRLGLCHPMTLSATLKVVASELRHGRMEEIEATARALHAKLSRRHEAPGTQQ